MEYVYAVVAVVVIVGAVLAIGFATAWLHAIRNYLHDFSGAINYYVGIVETIRSVMQAILDYDIGAELTRDDVRVLMATVFPETSFPTPPSWSNILRRSGMATL